MKDLIEDDSFEMPDEADIPDETGLFLHSARVLTAQQKLVIREQKTNWPVKFAILNFLISVSVISVAASLWMIVVASNLDLLIVLLSVGGYVFWKSVAEIACGMLNNRS
jgi:hypothetical protein